MYDRNQPSAVFTWADKALRESEEITKEEAEVLLRVAVDEITKGGLRGDVCDRWREMGYDSSKIKDFYP